MRIASSSLAVLALSFLLTAITHGPTWARTWIVTADGSGDAPTIQAALDQAAPGDSVLVGPGTYTDLHTDTRRDLVVVELKEGVIVVSRDGAPATILDATLPSGDRRVVSAYDCAGAALIGFTVTSGGLYTGSGITLADCDVLIQGCRIVQNSGAEGGGIAVRGDCSPQILDNWIEGNTACCGPGGGIYVLEGASPRIEGNHISGNWGYFGGAIGCSGAGQVEVRRNLLIGNTGLSGGGIGLLYTPAIVEENWVLENIAEKGGGVYSWYSSEARLSHNIVARSVTTGEGGGYYFVYSSSLLESETIVGNTANQGSGVFSSLESSPTISNCIVAFNENSEGIVADNPETAPTILCCDVYGHAFGDFGGYLPDPTGSEGNISVDPVFCSLSRGSYYLADASPLRGDSECGLRGALADPCPASDLAGQGFGVTGVIQIPRRQDSGRLISSPNPTHGPVAIRWSGAVSRVERTPSGSLLILDVAGRLVRQLPWSGQEVLWDGSDAGGRQAAPGVYWAKLRLEHSPATADPAMGAARIVLR